MLFEVDPRTAVKFLADFERVLGPDPLGRDQVRLDLGRRQALAAQRWAFTGGCSPGFYIALAALVGAAITITRSPARNAAQHSAATRCARRATS